MSSSETIFSSPDQSEYFEYKPISSTSVVGLVFALISLAALLFPELLLLPVIGIIVSLYSVKKIRKFRDEMTGMGMAKTAAFLNVAIFITGSAYHSYIYATEVPEGYQRISFADLQPIPGQPGPVPQTAVELDGEKVFIKGYTFPGEKRRNLKSFVLVPDLGTCCFGGQPALTDMIEVTLDDPLRADYSMSYRKLTGVLEVDQEIKPISGIGGVYYRLKADGIK
ncbi:MAG: DUF3299 domain-containing protein [Pirellulales bacterium]|nr:DUF3299 domain-containing protein [Pirellulales bacterium]